MFAFRYLSGKSGGGWEMKCCDNIKLTDSGVLHLSSWPLWITFHQDRSISPSIYTSFLKQPSQNQCFSFVPVSPIVYYTLDKRTVVALEGVEFLLCAFWNWQSWTMSASQTEAGAHSFVSLLKSVVLPLALFKSHYKIFSCAWMVWFSFKLEVF